MADISLFVFSIYTLKTYVIYALYIPVKPTLYTLKTYFIMCLGVC